MSLWILVFAMNAFFYLVPIYCAARALSDYRQGRIFWAASGCISGAVAWSMLGFVIVGSVGVAIYVFARTVGDLNRATHWMGDLCVAACNPACLAVGLDILHASKRNDDRLKF